MNIRTLAKDLNLSSSTVSICLSGKPEDYKITQETVKRVRDYADKVGYVPNHWARKIFKEDSETIGLMVINDNGLDKSNRALRWIMEELGRHNKDFVVQVAQSRRWRDVLNNFKSMKIKRIIFVGFFAEYTEDNADNMNVKANSTVFREFAGDETLKFFAMDYCFPGYDSYEKHNFYRIGSNRQETYLELCRILKADGKGPIICDEECFTGYLKRHGMVADDFEPLPGLENSFEAGVSLAGRVGELWRAGKARVVLLHNDRRAIGLIRGLVEAGLKVPDDIEVIGFSNLDFSAECPIPLTTIHIPMEENAKILMEALVNDRELPEKIVQPAKIIWRKSAIVNNI